MTWQGELKALVGPRYKVKLGPNGYDLILKPGAMRWRNDAFFYVVDNQDAIRRDLGGAVESPEILLGAEEMMLAGVDGVLRRVRRIRAGRADLTSPHPDGTWSQDIEGALAEMALAKHLNIYWTGSEGRGAADVGGYEVRWTKWPDGRLRVHKREGGDNENAIKKFALVTGKEGIYRIRGWMKGTEAQAHQEWYENPKSGWAYWVPQDELNTNFG